MKVNILPVLDLPELKSRLSGDVALFFELFELFFTDYAGHYQRMKELMSGEKCDLLAETAHSLKGALANLSAKSAAAICHEIEKAARAGDFKVERQLVELSGQIAELRSTVEELKGKTFW